MPFGTLRPEFSLAGKKANWPQPELAVAITCRIRKPSNRKSSEPVVILAEDLQRLERSTANNFLFLFHH